MKKLLRLDAIKLIATLLLFLSFVLILRYYPFIYKIGDTGPAGGIVFFITSNGFNGLEAAPEDLNSVSWGCFNTVITGADGVTIGTGEQNTLQILKSCGHNVTAAYLADLYELNGYKDWFLPSKDELNLMYLNIGKGSVTLKNVGGFDDAYYWSSSEIGKDIASIQYFGNNIQIGGFKNIQLRMRVIRAF